MLGEEIVVVDVDAAVVVEATCGRRRADTKNM